MSVNLKTSGKKTSIDVQASKNRLTNLTINVDKISEENFPSLYQQTAGNLL